jgi:hypothetical protein
MNSQSGATRPLEEDNAETCTESEINLALLDPSRWGWTAGGGIADLLPPHEVRRTNYSDERLIMHVTQLSHSIFHSEQGEVRVRSRFFDRNESVNARPVA